MTELTLGAFSISLAVKDIEASAAFYAKLGFVEVGGNLEQKWLILRNADHVIGLFEGMFDQNIMTFNPGWHQDGSDQDSFTDIRALQRSLQAAGIVVENPVDESGSGPASFSVTDPDGNSILFDQHRS